MAARPSNKGMKQTKPAQAMELRSLSPVLCGPLGRRDMARMTHRARFFVAVVLLVVPSPGNVRGETDGTLVAVLALPSADRVQTSRATDELAQALASELRSGGLRVVVAGSPIAVPLEELAASANAAGVDVALALGIRSSGTSAGCARVLTPQAVSRPAHMTSKGGQAQLGADLMKLISAMRYEALASAWQAQ